MLKVLDITAPDINNGLGCRVTLWVAGCKHHCKGCHNQWTWNFNQGKDFTFYRREIFEDLSEWLDKDYIDGITFSGGDPLTQTDEALTELYDIITWVKKRYPEKNIWLFTGYTKEQLDELNNKIINKILNDIDVLVDGPYVEELRDIAHTPFRGSTNQRLIELHK